MRLPIALLSLLIVVHPQPTSPTISDADEIRLGQMLADDFIAQEGMEPTPQTKKLDEYLQSVGDRVAAFAQRNFLIAFALTPALRSAAPLAFPGDKSL
jgi:hypothetical protein